MRRALLAFPLLTACYTYTAVPIAVAQPGTMVRARISGGTAEQLEPLLGVSDARSLTGQLIANDADTLIVEVPTTVHTEIGNTVQTLNQRVGIPRVAILELETRKLNRAKTAVVATAATVVAGSLIFRAVKGERGLDLFTGGGSGDLRVTLLRIEP